MNKGMVYVYRVLKIETKQRVKDEMNKANKT